MRDDDWRLMGQEEYLQGVTLVRREYRQYAKNANWDHDHCEFCGIRFSVDPSVEAERRGYATEDEYRWVCTACFDDFQARFDWKVVPDAG